MLPRDDMFELKRWKVESLGHVAIFAQTECAVANELCECLIHSARLSSLAVRTFEKLARLRLPNGQHVADPLKVVDLELFLGCEHAGLGLLGQFIHALLVVLGKFELQDRPCDGAREFSIGTNDSRPNRCFGGGW